MSTPPQPEWSPLQASQAGWLDAIGGCRQYFRCATNSIGPACLYPGVGVPGGIRTRDMLLRSSPSLSGALT